ncbi:hypothetical protein SADUNF_Sadunf18G0041100 [Salix dunnii]|uniref:Uncharacterized protein n=1 Tax=Salix dunnii TaxID=1413687 RepID=A0A835J5W7_9ROSI|nr:hypothetical protein SADUNF_Sadunf18G0041100 [Salix dunnii]
MRGKGMPILVNDTSKVLEIKVLEGVSSMFDNPEKYKHLIKSRNTSAGDGGVGSVREVKYYKSITSSDEFNKAVKVYTIVLESYIVAIAGGNTGEDTKMFVDSTVVNLNLQTIRIVDQFIGFYDDVVMGWMHGVVLGTSKDEGNNAMKRSSSK